MNELEIFRITLPPSASLAPEDDPLFTENGLALHLTAIKVLKESSTIKNKETLKIIHNAIGEGIAVTSEYNIKLSMRKTFINIYPHQNPTSVFMLIEDWLKKKRFIDKNKTNALKTAIFQGERKRKERLTYIQELRNISKVPN